MRKIEMNKLAVVTSCDSCPNNWFYLGVDCCCLLMNKKPCYDNESDFTEENENIPIWCPLPNSSTEQVSK